MLQFCEVMTFLNIGTMK